jgi:peptidoglycan/xylan/chitin deacetylase (PgdA/CDA1 family)
MKAVMYHYVQEFNPKIKYLSYLNYKNFEKQLKVFQKSFGFIDCSKAKNFDANINLKKKIFLTFDDGLLCHYNYVFPILKKNNINAIFYIPTAPYINEKILGVHKIHLILGFFGGEVACNFLDKYLDITMLDSDLIEEFEKFTYVLQVNSDYINKFKRVLNYYIKYEYRDKVIDDIFINFFGNKEKDMIKNVYMSLNQINELYKAGMVIGSHGVSHRLMSRLNEEEFKNEIDNSFDLLRNFGVY